MSIESDLDAFGIAQVLVVLKPSEQLLTRLVAEDQFANVVKHFVVSEQTRDGALAAARSSFSSEGSPSIPAPEYHVYPNLGLMLGTVDREGKASLDKSSKVDKVLGVPEMSLIRPVASRDTTKRVVGATWGLKKMKVPELWTAGFKGKGVIVGHLDTGVDGKHPALKTAIHAFAQFDEVGEQIAGAKPTDSGTHGTHTAGTIAGRPVPEGSFGVAPECKLASAMVIEGGNIIARILGGMDWVIGQKAKILSMSLGLRGYRTEFQALMQIIRNRGLLPVIAVGNEGAGTSRSPGNYSVSLSVGASNERDRVAGFSSSQRFARTEDPIVPDIVAPGVAVFSALPNGRFGEKDGSSMATPHVAGLAALLWEAKPTATVDEIEAAIYASCHRPDTMPEERANRGCPNAVLAYEYLTGRKLSVRPASKKKSKPVATKKVKKSAKVAKKTAKVVKKKVASKAASKPTKRKK